MPETRLDDAPAPPNESMSLIADLLGGPIAPERVAFAAAYLREVRDAADSLLALDLEGIEPDAVYDPRWPEARA